MLDLTKTLASEFGSHGVRVNAVSPGAVIFGRGGSPRAISRRDSREPVLEGAHPALGDRGPGPLPRLARLRHGHRPEHRRRRQVVSQWRSFSRSPTAWPRPPWFPSSAAASRHTISSRPAGARPCSVHAESWPAPDRSTSRAPCSCLGRTASPAAAFVSPGNFIRWRRICRASLIRSMETAFRARGPSRPRVRSASSCRWRRMAPDLSAMVRAHPIS